MNGIEQWKPVPGFESFYEVSDRGRVRSFDRYVNHWRGGKRLHRGRMLRTFPGTKGRSNGYLRVALYRPGAKRLVEVHVLVLEAFIGPRPPGLVCCHYNGNPVDNRLENLRWDTLSANSFDDIRNGVHPAASKTHCRNGHLYSDENTRVGPAGRHCRTCERQAGRSRLRADAVERRRMRAALCRKCVHCGCQLSVDLRRDAVYCSSACSKRAHVARKAVSA